VTRSARRTTRRAILFLRVFVVGLLGVTAGATFAQPAYPVKPVRVITPYSAGGVNDLIGRPVVQKLSESLGQSVIFDNRPGGNTIIGLQAVARAPADGYTLLQLSGSYLLTTLLLPTPFDAAADFTPVATIASTEYILVVHPSLPVKNLKELIALAKARPGQLNYASTGTGGAVHVTTELFKMMTGIDMVHIPYKGGSPAVADLVAGNVQLHFSAPITVVPFIRSGRLKAIAIGGEKRSPALPSVPTFTEAGLPGFDVRAWYGWLAPTGTPRPIIERLSTEISRILAMPAIRENLQSQGMEPFVSTPEQMAKRIAADRERFAKIVKTANIRIEN
jgi:tripartite-type tricarboxylate transporter receptor subunit TctC